MSRWFEAQYDNGKTKEVIFADSMESAAFALINSLSLKKGETVLLIELGKPMGACLLFKSGKPIGAWVQYRIV